MVLQGGGGGVWRLEVTCACGDGRTGGHVETRKHHDFSCFLVNYLCDSERQKTATCRYFICFFSLIWGEF